MATKKYLIGIVAAISLAVLVAGVTAQSFGTAGQSSTERTMGICVVEIDEVVTGVPGITGDESLDLVITETGRKPAVGKVQSLLIFSHDIDRTNGDPQVTWDGTITYPSQTLGRLLTGTADKKATFAVANLGVVLSKDNLATDLTQVVGPLIMDMPVGTNGFPIISQARAGEIRIPLEVDNDGGDVWDLNIIAVVESPAGNRCEINLIPRF